MQFEMHHKKDCPPGGASPDVARKGPNLLWFEMLLIYRLDPETSPSSAICGAWVVGVRIEPTAEQQFYIRARSGRLDIALSTGGVGGQDTLPNKGGDVRVQ